MSMIEARLDLPSWRMPSWRRHINTVRHETALWVFFAVVNLHLLEHVVQAVQIWALDWPRPDARGVAGLPFPWLVTSEAMHYGYAVVMLAGFVLLRRGFTGRSSLWWDLALAIQVWHHFEHLILLLQRISGPWFGRAEPTSILQLFVSRVELHLFYNGVVLVPMLVAMYFHRYQPVGEPTNDLCTCHRGHL